MTDRTIIGQRIAELRKNKGLTQAELADMIGVSHQAVSQWERSETLPDILTLPILADIFGQSISSVMGIEETNTAEISTDNAEPEITVEVEEGDGSGEAVDFKPDTYEILIRKNGEEIKNFPQQTDKFVKVVVNGNVHTLNSDMGVTVNGNVMGNATSGFEMRVSGDVGGDVTSGFDTNCGNVQGSVSAGFGVNCANIEGQSDSGFGVHESHNEKAIEKVVSEGKTREINGDCDFDINGVSSVVIMGDMKGDISNCHTVTIGADMSGDIGEITGEVNIGGDVSGDVNIKVTGDLNIDGDFSGDVNCSDGDVNISGDVDGDINAGGSITIDGDVDGDVDAGSSISVGGDVDGSLDAGTDISVGGDVGGDVQAGGDVAVNGDVEGGINTSGDVSVGGDFDGEITSENDMPKGKLDKNFGNDIAEYVKKVIRQHLEGSLDEE